MHLDNFVEIISGKILNTPCISSINKLTSNISRIQVGDAFIARNKNDINDALSRGAYAIVVDSCVDMVDDEVAWILVGDIEMSILKFVKYVKLMSSMEIYYFDEISFLLAKGIIRDKQVGIASNVDELLESIDKRYILINFDILIFCILYLESYDDYSFHITKQTLFETKLEFQNKEYNLIIPKIFIRDLNNVISFCKHKFINFVLQIDSDALLPIFIAPNALLSSYGYSMRFVYASLNDSLIRRYIEFVNDAPWGRSLCITNNHYENIECKSFSSLESLKQIFQDSAYHFFVVDGVECSDIKGILEYSVDSPSLFD